MKNVIKIFYTTIWQQSF